MPLVSIIIPNYNHYKFLEKRFDSILNQTYQDFEIIYLDDASTDNSNAIFNKYSTDQRIRALFNDKNSGNPFIQWNRGLSEAKGEYIWIAESDDYSHIMFLEIMVDVLEINPNIGLAYCQSIIVDEDNQHLYNNEKWTEDIDAYRWRKNHINNGRDEIANYLSIKNTIPNASSVLLRRSVLVDVNGAPEDFRYCGDWITWINILNKSDIAFVAEPLNNFRAEHGLSVRRFAYKEGLSILEALSVILYIKNLLPLNDEILMRSMLYRYNVWKEISVKNHIPFKIQKKIIGLFKKIIPGFEYKIYAYFPLILFKRSIHLIKSLFKLISNR